VNGQSLPVMVARPNSHVHKESKMLTYYTPLALIL
jgi:hypothetical protein